MRWLKQLFGKTDETLDDEETPRSPAAPVVPVSFSQAATFGPMESSCSTIKVSPQGDMLALNPPSTNTLTVVDSTTGEVISILKMPLHSLDYTFAPDAKSLLLSEEEGVSKLDIESGECVRIITVGKDHEKIYNMALSNDGKMCTLECFRAVSVWDLDSGKPISKIKVDTPTPRTLFLPGDNLVLVGGQSLPLAIYKVQTGSLAKNDYSPLPWCGTLNIAMAQQGQLIFISSASGRVFLYELSQKTPLLDSEPHGSGIKNLAVSPDGSFFVTLYASTYGSDPIVWSRHGTFASFETGRTANSIALSPDGKRLFVSHQDKTVSVWNVLD